jgi:hypothetical protein
LGLVLVLKNRVSSNVNMMPIRVRVLKKLLYRLLLTASLLIAPVFFWVRMPLLNFVFEDASSRTEATDESCADDAEWEACSEETRIGSQARLRVRRRAGRVEHVAERRAEVPQPARFALVVDVRRVKPKRLFAPPYLAPRVVRLLS